MLAENKREGDAKNNKNLHLETAPYIAVNKIQRDKRSRQLEKEQSPSSFACKVLGLPKSHRLIQRWLFLFRYQNQ